MKAFFSKLWARVRRFFTRGLYPWEVTRPVGHRPAVSGFTPYFLAPSMQDRLEHAERATERWFQEFCADLFARAGKPYRRPLFNRHPIDDLSENRHQGHRHAVYRRKRAREAIEQHGRVQTKNEFKRWRVLHQAHVAWKDEQQKRREAAYWAGKRVAESV